MKNAHLRPLRVEALAYEADLERAYHDGWTAGLCAAASVTVALLAVWAAVWWVAAGGAR